MRIKVKSILLGILLSFILIGPVSSDTSTFNKNPEWERIPSPLKDFQFDYGPGVDKRLYYYGNVKHEALLKRKKNKSPVFPIKLLKIPQYKIQLLVAKGILIYSCETGYELYRFADDPDRALAQFQFRINPDKKQFPRHPLDGWFFECQESI